MSRSTFCLTALTAALASAPLSAQLPQGVVRGDLIRVRSGASTPWLTGAALESRNDSLFLEKPNRTGMVSVGNDQIVALQRGTRHAATGKGALLGLGAGVAFGVGMGLVVGADEGSFFGCPAECVAMAGGVFGLIGAGAGALIGAAIHTTRWVDLGTVSTRVAVTPVVAGGRVGAMVTLRFGKRAR